ncbi:hypothetical protein [Serratia sp. UGAL515B_01]|uniref:hypothetical protein n=1 Tax=Serratia sp. UGAL515B_01 TaxID=2986763 RepID=UPI002955D1F8|nr:hypothetical protein [Serratia sp. UGAL515B_01]WON76307.1 hypothetical protein OK023_13860 [Serratia sp. UGAL515B_01]
MSKGINIQRDGPNLIKSSSKIFGSIKENQTIDGLNADQTRALAIVVSARESTNNKRIVNQSGYLGLFQFGAEALANVGLIKKANVKRLLEKYPEGKGLYTKKNGVPSPHEQFLRDDSNWILPGGMNAYLSDVGVQYKAFIDNTNSNIKMGMRVDKTYKKTKNGRVVDKEFSPALNKNSSAAKIAGFAMSSHMKPLGAVKYYALGIDDEDGNNTSVSSYAKLGEQAVTILAPNLEGYQGENHSSSFNNDKNNIEEPLLLKLQNEVKEQRGIGQPLPLTQEVKDKYKDTGYKYGANGQIINGKIYYDCSHLTHAVGKNLGYDVPYENSTALAKSKYYEKVDPENVRPGDFAVWPGQHVGIVETPIDPNTKIGHFYSTRGPDKVTGEQRGPASVEFGPNAVYWNKSPEYRRVKTEFLDKNLQKNTAATQQKPTSSKAPAAARAAKSNSSVAKVAKPDPQKVLAESVARRAVAAVNWAQSKLKQYAPNLALMSKELASRQPEDFRSAKGCCCCCSAGNAASTVINQNTSITLNSACKDHQELGKIVANAQDKANRDTVRKLTPRTS